LCHKLISTPRLTLGFGSDARNTPTLFRSLPICRHKHCLKRFVQLIASGEHGKMEQESTKAAGLGSDRPSGGFSQIAQS
jgi:hypothetical protein